MNIERLLEVTPFKFELDTTEDTLGRLLTMFVAAAQTEEADAINEAMDVIARYRGVHL